MIHDTLESNSRIKVWVLEDDAECQFVYEQTLNSLYSTKYFKAISDITGTLSSTSRDDRPNVIVADLMLEDGNFIDFLVSTEDREIFNLPFMIVSSIDDVDALRLCFKEGALDYLTKPFRKNELLVKIENILNRKEVPQVVGHKSLMIDGQEITNLTSKQMQMLSLFVETSTRQVSRESIVESVWGDTKVHPKTIDVHLYNLRRKLYEFGYMIRSDGGGKWSLLSYHK